MNAFDATRERGDSTNLLGRSRLRRSSGDRGEDGRRHGGLYKGMKREGSPDCGGAGERGGVVDGRAYNQPVVWHRLFGLLNIM